MPEKKFVFRIKIMKFSEKNMVFLIGNNLTQQAKIVRKIYCPKIQKNSSQIQDEKLKKIASDLANKKSKRKFIIKTFF